MPLTTTEISDSKFFLGKRVLVFGLGVLGGGIATTNWLLKRGADVTVTDIKTKEQLAGSLRRLSGKVRLNLGGHSEEDIHRNDVIVFNPDIHVLNPYVELARRLGKIIENEATLFYQLCHQPVVAITGTRGKTTTTNWIHHLLKLRYTAIMAGNSSNDPFLRMLDRIHTLESKNGSRRKHISKPLLVVNELPSYHLEIFNEIQQTPEIAVMTNLYPDHLNRYLSLEDYANTKSHIFINQTQDQHLILNYDNEWTPFFIDKKPRSTVWGFSMSPFLERRLGVFLKNDCIFVQGVNQSATKVLDVSGFSETYGEHNLENLLAASLTAHLRGVPWPEIQAELGRLPQIPFRQETIFENERVKIINDTTATTPEGSLVAIKRFGSSNCVLITGGTDRELDYAKWADVVRAFIRPDNIVMLSGSATDKMLKVLGPDARRVQVLDTLHDCVKAALLNVSKYRNGVVLFSPASKSFEKFRNEMDRGKQFNKLVKREVTKQWTIL